MFSTKRVIVLALAGVSLAFMVFGAACTGTEGPALPEPAAAQSRDPDATFYVVAFHWGWAVFDEDGNELDGIRVPEGANVEIYAVNDAALAAMDKFPPAVAAVVKATDWHGKRAQQEIEAGRLPDPELLLGMSLEDIEGDHGDMEDGAHGHDDGDAHAEGDMPGDGDVPGEGEAHGHDDDDGHGEGEMPADGDMPAEAEAHGHDDDDAHGDGEMAADGDMPGEGEAHGHEDNDPSGEGEMPADGDAHDEADIHDDGDMADEGMGAESGMESVGAMHIDGDAHAPGSPEHMPAWMMPWEGEERALETHGFLIPWYGVAGKLPADATEPVRVVFTADRAGTFDFVCTVYCGFGHRYQPREMLYVEPRS